MIEVNAERVLFDMFVVSFESGRRTSAEAAAHVTIDAKPLRLPSQPKQETGDAMTLSTLFRAARFVSAFAAGALILLITHPGMAAEARYPDKAVRFIVPFPPGGGTDILARLIAQRLTGKLGQQFIVDNRPGAGTNIGMQLAARSTPDGYTLLMASIGLAANPSLYRRLTYDPLRDLAPVTLVAIAPTILVVHPSLPASTAQELIALAKSQPGHLNYGSFGSGSGSHLAAELFKLETGTDIVHVPYKGGGPAITALLGKEIQLVFSSMLPVLSHLQSGRLKAIGLAAAKRSPAAPDVPTFREQGIAYETGTWFGMLVPSGTPRDIIDLLHRETAQILKSEEIDQRITREGAEPIGNTPDQFAAFIQQEAARWAKVVKAAKIKVE